MQVTKATEIWVGAFTAFGLVALFFVAMQVSNLGDLRSSQGSYVIKAHFGNVGSLKVRAPVSMAGVTLGRVERIAFDRERYEALVEMRIDPEYSNIPEDTSASILTAGLLGEQYIGLSAGGSDDFLKQGDEIELTQSAMVLEQLISKFMFNKAEEGKGDKKPAQADGSDETQKGQTAPAVPAQASTPTPSVSHEEAAPRGKSEASTSGASQRKLDQGSKSVSSPKKSQAHRHSSGPVTRKKNP